MLNENFIETQSLTKQELEEKSSTNLVLYAKNLIENSSTKEVNSVLNEIKIILNNRLDSFSITSNNNDLDSASIALKNENIHLEFKKFLELYNLNKKRVASFFENEKLSEQKNYEYKLKLIEELRQLYSSNNSTKDIYKNFREILTDWKNTQRVPKDKLFTLNENFSHHLNNFYSFLDLNKELQNKLFQENLAIRHQLIAYAKNLVVETNIKKALNEIFLLQEKWNDASPVDKKDNASTWEEFKELSNKIYARKKDLLLQQKKEKEENLTGKKFILEKLNTLINEAKENSNLNWKKTITTFEELKSDFLAIGKVESLFENDIWKDFKDLTKEFYSLKTNHFNELRKTIKENIIQKKNLIESAKEQLVNKNLNEAVFTIKKLQNDWKNTGYIDRIENEKLWSEFKSSCDDVFEKNRNLLKTIEEHKSNLIGFKDNFLKEISLKKITGEKDEIFNEVCNLITTWYSKDICNSTLHQDIEFEKQLTKICEEAEINLSILAKKILETKLSFLVNYQSVEKLDKIILEDRKNQQKIELEINQKENNLGFFKNSKNNSFTKSIIEDIEEKKSILNAYALYFRELKKHIKTIEN